MEISIINMLGDEDEDDPFQNVQRFLGKNKNFNDEDDDDEDEGDLDDQSDESDEDSDDLE